MKWTSAVSEENGSTKIPDNWLFLHYYEALNVLFRIENMLRIFVYVVLKDGLKEEWLNINVVSDDSEQGTINSIAKKRINQAKNFGYLGYQISCPLMYLTSGELIRVITSDAYWKYFSKYFQAKKEVISNKLDEISNVRNSLAHFRPISVDDVGVIKQNAKHVLLAIERDILQIFNIYNIVPTNTADDWYKELNVLGTENCALSFFQSKNDKWVKINIKYNCSIISQNFNKTFIRYEILNILASNILKEYNNLTNHLIYLSEQIPYPSIDDKFKTNYRKNIVLVFSRDMLKKCYKDIKLEIEKLLQTITTEIELIRKDPSAKGKIVEVLKTYAFLRDKTWSFNTKNLTSIISENDPPEFWGDIFVFSDDFVAETHKYPWLPVDVSKDTSF